jgi:uncharacterized damage-inducible protein DinB
MDRMILAEWWDEAHEKGVWWASWRDAVNVTAEQAAWKPAPGRHSIWQLVSHLIFWRRYMLRRVAGGESWPQERIDAEQWIEPDEPTEEAWAESRRQFEESHVAIRSAFAEGEGEPDRRLRYFLQHDCYHVGQIMYLRALQGLPPLES